MSGDKSKNRQAAGQVAAHSAIFLSFIVALELVIMITPFAFFSTRCSPHCRKKVRVLNLTAAGLFQRRHHQPAGRRPGHDDPIVTRAG